MKEFKLHRTDGKTFFEFRSNPESRCEGFTLSYLDDGTVVMSGDYGTLCWKRNYRRAESDDFDRDYGFPNTGSGISYFDEKVCQFGVKQETQVWNKDEAIKMFKERYSDEGDKEKYEEALRQIEWLEEYDETKFYELVNELDCDFGEYEWKVYSDSFKFMFEALKGVAEKVWDAVEKAKVSGTHKTEFGQSRFDEDVPNANEREMRKLETLQGSNASSEVCWKSEPELGRVANGISNRVDRIKCLGNAVVPQVAEVFAEAIKMNILTERKSNG